MTAGHSRNRLQLIIMAAGAAFLYFAFLGTKTVTDRLSRLPVEGQRPAAPVTPAISGNDKIYLLLKESRAKATNPGGGDVDSAFNRAIIPEEPKPEAPPPPPPPPPPPKPNWTELVAKAARITAVADSGLFINGRYYRVGESMGFLQSALRVDVKLAGVKGCKAILEVDGESVELNGCKR